MKISHTIFVSSLATYRVINIWSRDRTNFISKFKDIALASCVTRYASNKRVVSNRSLRKRGENEELIFVGESEKFSKEWFKEKKKKKGWNKSFLFERILSKRKILKRFKAFHRKYRKIFYQQYPSFMGLKRGRGAVAIRVAKWENSFSATFTIISLRYWNSW